MSEPPLSVAAVAAELGPLASRFDVDVLAQCDSTNSRLIARAEAGAGSGTVVVAERQTAGRGRLGRTWFSAPGDSLTFSLLWRFPRGTVPAGLSLAVGIALVDSLRTLGTAGVALKWPNDVLRDGRKLAGVLIELVPGAPHSAIIGIGINRRLPSAMPADVRATSAALDVDVPASRLLALILGDLSRTLAEFALAGFAAMRERWLGCCAHLERPVCIVSEFSPPLDGRCVGVDVDGALLVEAGSGVQRVLSGDVSLRLS